MPVQVGEEKKKNCNWWLFKSAPKRNALAADNSISNWISRARSLARRSYSCSESTCCRMQAKPGAPPRGYCYRAGSKHAAHGKVTIRGSEAFGRTGGWMEKRCNVTLKSFIGRFFFFSVSFGRHPAFISLMCLCLLTGGRRMPGETEPRRFPVRDKGWYITQTTSLPLQQTLSDESLCHNPRGKGFRDRFRLVAQCKKLARNRP